MAGVSYTVLTKMNYGSSKFALLEELITRMAGLLPERLFALLFVVEFL